jgi:DNA repair exonuclease SbcCD ATPase subunit
MSRIVKFEAENFKRLKAVEITPTGDLVVISGRNHQGKSSILDAIFAALRGAKSAKEISQPIREGQDTALVKLEVGEPGGAVEYVITRRWDKNDSGTLTVESGDRAKYNAPQKLLDKIIGDIAFDPQQFLDLDTAKQVNALVAALGEALPFDPAELAAKRQGMYDRRTEVGREVKRLEGQLASLPAVPADVPETEVSATELLAEIETTRQANEKIARAHAELETNKVRVQDALAAFQRAQSELAQAKSDLGEHAAVVSALPAPVEIGPLAARLETLEATNAKVRQRTERTKVEAALATSKEEQGKLTAGMQLIDKEKAEGIAAASFPVPELSFDDSGVTYNGRPLSQASTEEQLRAAFGVAITANPELRVCRIDRGEALDSESLAVLGKLAAEHDIQVWISRVDERGTVGFVIEDGEVVA